VLQVIEECADERRVEVGELDLGGGLAGRVLGEAEQELPAVAVGGDRVAAGLALASQIVGEE
jgi:hypothetical protein